jgi:hypothetical protein
MIYTPKTLRLVTARTFGDVSHDILAHAAAWEAAEQGWRDTLDRAIKAENDNLDLRQRLEAADALLEHRKVFGCDKGAMKCAICERLIAALAAGESGKCV